MSLAAMRQAIRPLLNPGLPHDAMEAYFTFHHADDRTRLVTWPPETAVADSGIATGYVAICRTGIDLFRPLVTLRLPPLDMEAGVALIYHALEPEMDVLLSAPESYLPLLRALFEIQAEEQLSLYTLSAATFRPVINVLVTQGQAANGLPRFAIRSHAAARSHAASGELVATAHLNWQSPQFGEIAVNVQPGFRRRGYGRSVLSAMAQHLLANGRTPLYATDPQNTPSVRLAQCLGFADTGARSVMLQVTLRPRPQ